MIPRGFFHERQAPADGVRQLGPHPREVAPVHGLRLRRVGKADGEEEHRLEE